MFLPCSTNGQNIRPQGGLLRQVLEIGDGFGEALIQRYLRLPAQDFAGLADIRLALGGVVLRQWFVYQLRTGADQRQLADSIHVPYQRVNELINGKRGVTPSTALRLARYFGVTPDFWLNLQARWDLYRVARNESEELESIQQHRVSK